MVWTFRAPLHQPHASQFVEAGPTGMCTLLALAACDVVSKGAGAWVLPGPVGDPASVANVQAITLRIYRDARPHNLCSPFGGMTQNQALAEAGRMSLAVRDTLPYRNADLPHDDWIAFLHRYVAWAARPYPVLMQVAAGHALIDNETGQADEATLETHAIAIYGTQTDAKTPSAGGYICADGDNPGANAHPAIYSLATLVAARPISLIAFDYTEERTR